MYLKRSFSFRVCNHSLFSNHLYKYQTHMCSIGVIGGGISGLGTLKELRDVGFNDITLFEHSHNIGGNWNHNNGLAGGYKGMISNSSYSVWPYSDYVYDLENYGYSIENHSKYTKIEDVYQHLRNYTNHFDLYQYIKFNSNITKVNKNNNNYKWDIIVQDNNNISNVNKYSFDKIVLCLGTFTNPKYPKNLNIHKIKEIFNGEIYHSKEIKKINSVKDKTVLVVGNSVSGSDVVEYAAMNGAKRVYNLYREPRLYIRFWQTDNVNNFDEPDHTLDSYIHARNTQLDTNKMAVYLNEYGFGNLTPNDFENSTNVKLSTCCGLEHFCREGIVRGIRGEFDGVHGNNVHLKVFDKNNSDTLKDIDVIIFATGYDINGAYNKILSKDIIDRFYKPNIKDKRHLLYLLTFIPGYETDNFAINGGNHVINTCVHELQSRLIGQVWNGGVTLPSIETQNEWIKDRLIDTDPFWFLPALSPHPYMDDIAEFINVLPKKDDFPIEYQYIYEQLKYDYAYPSQFRITGPGSNDEIKMKSIKILAKLLALDKRESKSLQSQVSGIPTTSTAKLN